MNRIASVAPTRPTVPEVKRSRAWIRAALAALIGLGLTLLLLEMAYRTYHLAAHGTPVWQDVAEIGRDPQREDRLNPIALDPRLGWRSAFNYRYDGLRRNVDGSTYQAHVSFDSAGFRMYGDPASRRPKILVIGDSQTQAVQVSDDDTYYARVGSDLNVEMFVYAAGGFGTLQEEMIVDDYFDTIKPDVIVWQYCPNDFVNNSFDLEQASYFNNNHLTRPYLENGALAYHLPASDPFGLRTFWGIHSRVMYSLLVRWDAFESQRRANDSVELAIERLGLQHEGFKRSVQTTDSLMGMLRARVGQVPIVAFSCGDAEPYSSALPTISSNHGIQYWPDVSKAVESAEAQGQVLRADDFHWNPFGHRLAATALEPHVRAVLSGAIEF